MAADGSHQACRSYIINQPTRVRQGSENQSTSCFGCFALKCNRKVMMAQFAEGRAREKKAKFAGPTSHDTTNDRFLFVVVVVFVMFITIMIGTEKLMAMKMMMMMAMMIFPVATRACTNNNCHQQQAAPVVSQTVFYFKTSICLAFAKHPFRCKRKLANFYRHPLEPFSKQTTFKTSAGRAKATCRD